MPTNPKEYMRNYMQEYRERKREREQQQEEEMRKIIEEEKRGLAPTLALPDPNSEEGILARLKAERDARNAERRRNQPNSSDPFYDYVKGRNIPQLFPDVAEANPEGESRRYMTEEMQSETGQVKPRQEVKKPVEFNAPPHENIFYGPAPEGFEPQDSFAGEHIHDTEGNPPKPKEEKRK